MTNWKQSTAKEARDFIEQLADSAAEVVRSLRVEDQTSVEDASRFLLLTLGEAIGRLEQARLEVMCASLYGGVSAGQMREWTGIPPAVAEREIADYEETMRSITDDE